MFQVSSMEISWQQYQIQASEFFRRLGFHTELEASVNGARAEHKVDVLVSGELHGIKFHWVIECKNWKTFLQLCLIEPKL